jgi:hypothetical protein
MAVTQRALAAAVEPLGQAAAVLLRDQLAAVGEEHGNEHIHE